MEDISDPELLRKKPNSDRKVSLYGYVRGTHMKNHITMHIPGKSNEDFIVWVCQRHSYEESYYCTYTR